MMITPVAAAPAATTTDGVTPPGGEGFEETMAAILGLAMQAPAAAPTQAALPEAAQPTTVVVPSEGTHVQASTVLPEPGAVTAPAMDTTVELPEASSPEAPTPTAPTLPHPGVRFPERRVATPAVGIATPAAALDAPGGEAPIAPAVAGEKTQPSVASRVDSASVDVTQVTLPVGAAAAVASAMPTGSPVVPTTDAPRARLQESGPIGQVGAIGPVGAAGAGATTRRAEPLEPTMQPATEPVPVGQTAVEERPVTKGERRNADTPSMPGPTRSDTPVTTAEAAPAHVGGHIVDGDTPVPSTMIQRVEEVVRRLENAPPPRSITLSIDDQGLTKVTVSVLSDGVRLTVPEGSQTPNGLVGQLERALESRGFDLSQDGRRQRPQDDQPQAPWTPPAAPRRPSETDAAVRL